VIHTGSALIGVVQKIRISPLLLLITSCSLQTPIPPADEAARSSLVHVDLQCLQKMVGMIKANPPTASLARPAPPSLIRIHGYTENSDAIRPHITIEPNGTLTRHLPDLDQADIDAAADPLHNSGLHIQILDDADLPLNAPIPDAQYIALAVQIVIWQIKHSIPDARVTSENTPVEARSTQDFQVRLDWGMLQSHMDTLVERCEPVPGHRR